MSILDFLVSVLNSSTSILYATLGLLVMQSSGVLNIGAEGMMLIGAFSAVAGSAMFGSAVFGALFAMVMTAVTGALFAFCTVVKKANQTVTGIALNLLATGLTTTLYRTMFGTGSGSTKVDSFQNVGPFTIPVYIGLVLVLVLHVFFTRTRLGFCVRGTGEYPAAINSMGINVDRVRFWSTVAGALIIGMGGAFLSIGQLSFFTEDMVSGRGYIALAAVIFGRYTAPGSLAAVLIFGAGEAMVYRFQAAGAGIPTQIILMIPYVLTILMITLLGKKGSGPAAIGIPYRKAE